MKKKSTKFVKPKIRAPKECYFCKEEREPYFMDVNVLSKFTTDRGKIVSRIRNGLCSKHQRRLMINIKYSRYLALMPYIARD